MYRKCTLVAAALIEAAVLVSVGGCSSRPAADNPYDPYGSSTKAPGKIEGYVFIEGRSEQGGVDVVIRDSSGAIADQPQSEMGTGHFISADIAPGAYTVELQAPVENAPVQQEVELLPGRTENVGLLYSARLPAVGTLTGQVVLGLDPSQGASGARVQAVRSASDGSTETFLTYTDGNGNFSFSGLPAGSYEVIAEREGYTFDRANGIQIDAPARSTDAALGQSLKIYPASAVVRFSVPQDDGSFVDGAPYTKRTDVNLLLLAFGGVNEMRISESSTMTQSDGSDVPWESHLAQKPVVLSSGEGQKTYYAQFRVMDGSVVRLTSDIFSTSIVLDQTPPSVTTVQIDPTAVVVGDTRYIRADSTAVPVHIEAADAYSRVAKVKVVTGSTDPALVAYDNISASGPVAIYETTISLSPAGDGQKDVTVQLQDAAGNETSAQLYQVMVDTTPPEILAAPGDHAIVPSPANGSYLTSLTPTLVFLVGDNPTAGVDGPVRMRYGTSQSNLGPWLTFASKVDMSLSLAEGASVQFFAEVEDAAGNRVPLDSDRFTVKLTGNIGGSVFLEGQSETGNTNLTDINVDIFDAAANPSSDLPTEASVPVDSYGSFLSGDLPAGDYQVRLANTGYVTDLVAPVTVTPARTANLGIHRLTRARGDLEGYFRLSDKLGESAAHGGILIEAYLAGSKQQATVTDASGYFNFSGLSALPIGGYSVRASYDGYAAVTANATVLTGQLTTLSTDTAPLLLSPVGGDFALCDRDDVIPGCSAILYTNKSQVLLGFTTPDTPNLYVRYAVGSFSNPGGTPTDDACASPPQEQCWNPYSSSTRFLADLSAQAEGPITIVAQFQLDTAVPQAEQQSTIIYDITPPSNLSFAIRHAGSSVALDGFTNATEVSLDLQADPGGDPGVDVAPLGTVFVSRSSTFDTGAGSRQYSKPGTQTFDLAPSEGKQTLYAWFCDRAGNCTPDCLLADPAGSCGDSLGAAAQASIVYDISTPDLSTAGVSREPTGPAIVAEGVDSWWTRAQAYDVLLGVGDTGYTAPGSGAAVPEVVAFEVSLSPTFVGAEWSLFDFESFPGATYTAPGTTLPLVDGDHVVHLRLRDAAGNVSGDLPFTLSLDTTPPGGSVVLGDGAIFTPRDYTNVVTPGTISAQLTTDALGGAVEIQTAWNTSLPDPYLDARQTFSNLIAVAPPAEGKQTLLVRFFDAAGNYSERTDSIIVDLTPPDDTASAACSSCTDDGSGTLYYNGDLGGAVVLSLFASDDSGRIDHVNIDADAGGAVPYSYAPSLQVSLPATVGAHSLDVSFFDPAGNSRAVAPLSVTYDDVVPTVSLLINGVASGITNTADVELDITSSDNFGVKSIEIANSASYAGSTVLSPTSTVNWRLANPTVSESKEVFVRVTDYAGNVSETSQTVTLDLLADITGSVALEGQSDNSGVSVQLVGTDQSGASVNLTTSTTIAGAYTFTNVNAGSYTLSFSKTGFSSDSVALAVSAGIDQNVGSTTLSVLRATVSGTITLSAGASGLDVSGSKSGVSLTLSNPNTSFTTTTDPTGAFVFNGVPYDLGSDYTLTASATGYGGGALVVNVDQAAVSGQDLTLTVDVASLSGTALLNDSATHGGILPTLSGIAFNGAAYTTSASLTDTAGSFSFANLPAGTYTVSFSKTDYEPAAYGPFAITAGSSNSLGTTVKLNVLTATVSGTTVLDVGSTGLSVSAAGTLVSISNGTYSASTVTDASGAYSFQNVPYSRGADYTVSASRTYFTTQSSTSFTLSTSTHTVSVLTLPLVTATVDGAVVLAAQTNHAGVTATLSGTAFNGESYVDTATSVDAAGSGTYQIVGVPPGTYSVSLSYTGYETASTDAFAITPPTGASLPAVTLVPETATVSGTISFDAGSSSLNVSGSRAGVSVTLENGYAGFSTVTDVNGAFVFNGVPFDVGDDYVLTATSPGFVANNTTVNVDQASVTNQNLTLTAALSTVIGNILLGGQSDHSGTSATLSGVAFNGTSYTTSGSTDASGNFSIGNVPSGSYTLTLEAIDFESMTTAVFAVSDASTVDLGALGTLGQLPGDLGGSITLVAGGVSGFSPGTDYSGVHVHLSNANVDVTTTTDSSGDYSFSDLPVGTYTIEARLANYDVRSIVEQVTANSTTVATSMSLPVLTTTVDGGACLWDNAGGAGCNSTYTSITVDLSGTAFNGSSFSASTSIAVSGGTAYTLVNIPAGRYSLSASASDHTDSNISEIIVETTPPGVAPTPLVLPAIVLVDALAPSAPQITTAHGSPINTTNPVTVSLATPSTDATGGGGNFRGYQIFGGDQGSWSAPQPGPSFSFTLRPNQPNVLQVRAVDWAGNVSDADSVVLVHDNTPPGLPADASLTVTNRDGEVEVSWNPAVGNDVGGYLVYYGSEPGTDVTAFAGNFADQGASPIDVGRNTRVRLTGLINDVNFRVGVRPYDQTQEGGPNIGDAYDIGLALPVELPLNLVQDVALDGAEDVAVAGGYVYVTSTSVGLTVYTLADLTSGATPTVVAQMPARTEGRISIYGDVAYLYGRDSVGVAMVDLADPTAPKLIGTVAGSTGRCYHVLATGDRKGTGTFFYGVFRRTGSDCSDTSTYPDLYVQRWKISGTSSPKAPSNVNFAAFLTAQPTAIVEDAQLVSDNAGNAMLHVGVALASGQLRTSLGGSPDYFIIDVHDPAAAPSVAVAAPLGQAAAAPGDSPGLGFDVSGPFMVNAAADQGIDLVLLEDYDFNRNGIIDASVPPGDLQEQALTPTTLRTAQLGMSVGNVRLLGNLLFVTARFGGAVLSVFDISELTSPRLVGSLMSAPATAGYFDCQLALVGNHALVVARPLLDPSLGILQVVDLADTRLIAPRVRVENGNLSLAQLDRSFLWAIDTLPNTALKGLRAFDVHDLEAPYPAAAPAQFFGLGGNVGGTAILADDGRHLLLAYRQKVPSPGLTLALVDVSNAPFPSLVSSTTLPGDLFVRGVELSGNVVLLADSQQMLRSFNIADGSFSPVSTLGTAYESGTELSVVGGYVYFGVDKTTDQLCRATFNGGTASVGAPSCLDLVGASDVPHSVRARGDDIVVMAEQAGTGTALEMWDRPTLTNLAITGSYEPFPDTFDSLSVYGTTAMMSKTDGVAVYDISTLTSPVVKLFQGGPGSGQAHVYGPYVVSGDGAVLLRQLK